MKMVVGNLQTHKSMVTHNTSTFAFFLQAALGQGWMQARTKKCEKRANTISREALLPRPQIKTATVRNRAAARSRQWIRVRTVSRDADGQRAELGGATQPDSQAVQHNSKRVRHPMRGHAQPEAAPGTSCGHLSQRLAS